jgi:hypothetical protein
MAHYKLVVFSDALDNRDDEFNAWYDNIHLKDVLAVDGIVAAQRFKLKTGDKWKYLALYELECDDPLPVIEELQSRAGTEVMPLTDAFDMEHYFMALAEPIGSHRTA